VLPGDFEADVTLFVSNDTSEYYDDDGEVAEEVHARAKRFAIYLEANTGARWDKMPIPVVIEQTFCMLQLHKINIQYKLLQLLHKRRSLLVHWLI
jgi:hypothetical protein